MTTDPSADPSPRALGESLAALAVQAADLRGQLRARNERLDQAGIHADLNLAARFDQMAQTVTDALETAAPRGPAASYWIGLDRDTHHAQLADLRRWADTVLRQHYDGYEPARSGGTRSGSSNSSRRTPDTQNWRVWPPGAD